MFDYTYMRRKSYSKNLSNCFCFQVKFKTHNNLGRLADVNKTDGTETAFRLYSLHLVLSVTYFSSDVETD